MLLSKLDQYSSEPSLTQRIKSVWTEDISEATIMNTNYKKQGCICRAINYAEAIWLVKIASYGSPHRIYLQVAGLMLDESILTRQMASDMSNILCF